MLCKHFNVFKEPINYTINFLTKTAKLKKILEIKQYF